MAATGWIVTCSASTVAEPSTIRLNPPSSMAGQSKLTSGRAEAFARERFPPGNLSSPSSQLTLTETAWGRPSSETVNK